MKRLRYFAYGSNLDIEQMRQRCPSAVLEGPAVLRDWRLAFGGHSERWGGPVATIVQNPGSTVHGVVYRISAEDMLLLDRYEGHPWVYQRMLTMVVGQGLRIWANTYVMSLDVESAPATRYIAVIRKAYRKLGFNHAALAAEGGC